MTTRAKDTVDPIVQRLRALARESPDLKDSARIYEAILPLLRDADLREEAVPLTSDQISAKMGSGVPLLADIDLDIDVDALRDLIIRLAVAIEAATRKYAPHMLLLPWLESSGGAHSAVRRIRIALEENKLDMGSLLPSVAEGKDGPILQAAQKRDLDPGLLMTLAQNALKPALRAWCRRLAPLAKEIPWHKGFCFVCGAAATLGELQENDQVKHLRCGSCGADWRFRRLQCIYCGNENHETKRYLYAEGRRERMHVEACDKCHGYLKVIASFTPTSPEMLPVEDLATLHLDYIAQERGYVRVRARSEHLHG